MNDNNTTSRRDLLRRTGVLAMGMMAWPMWMPRVALADRDTPTQGDILVCIFQRGAADGLNLVVPYGDKDYYSHRDTLALPQPNASSDQAVIDLDGFFGLHPLLRPLKDIYAAGALAVVHAVGSPDPTHSHFDAMDFMERGTPGEKSIPTGWVGRHLQQIASNNQSPFRAVGMGTLLQQSLRGPVSATALQSIADFHLLGNAKQTETIQNALASLYQGDGFIETEGLQTLQAMRDLAKIASNNYTPANGAIYPNTPYGKSLATVAQLIKAGMGLEVACVDIGGWDTHVQEGTTTDGQMPRLVSEFANGLAAFYTDLQDQMKRITLVTMSEFGRRVQENSSHGTDHGHGNVMFVMGGGINGGKVYGEWPGLSKDNLYGPGEPRFSRTMRRTNSAASLRTAPPQAPRRRLSNCRSASRYRSASASNQSGAGTEFLAHKFRAREHDMLNRLFYTSAVSLLLFASACTPRQVARDVSEMATQVAPVAQQVLSTIVSATASTSPSTPTVPSPTPRRARVPASRPRSVTPPPSDVPIELGGAPLALTRTAHENIYVANGSPNSFVQEVIADAALTAQRMMQDEGWSGAPNVGIFVFPSREVWLQGIAQIGQLPQNQVQFQAQLGGDAWITISGTAHPGFYIYPIQQSPFETLHMLTHEYTHAIQRQVLGDSASVPDWFLEGMAEAEGWRIAGLTDARAYRQEHDEVSAFVRAAERRHRLPPLTSLSTSQSWEAHMESPRSATLEYAEGQLAIEYLQQLKGANAPMNILRATAAQGSFGEAFQQTAVDDSAIPSQF